MKSFIEIRSAADIPERWRATPIEALLRYHNLGVPLPGRAERPELLIGMSWSRRSSTSSRTTRSRFCANDRDDRHLSAVKADTERVANMRTRGALRGRGDGGRLGAQALSGQSRTQQRASQVRAGH